MSDTIVTGRGPLWVKTLRFVGLVFIFAVAVKVTDAILPIGASPTLGFGDLLMVMVGIWLVFMALYFQPEADDG